MRHDAWHIRTGHGWHHLHRKGRLVPVDQVPIRLVAAAGAAVALTSPARPTGARFADLVLTAGFVFVMAVATSRAQRWSWLVLCGVAATTAGPVAAQIAGGLALALTLSAVWDARRMQQVGVWVGVLASNALLWGTALRAAAAVPVAIVASGAVLLSAYRAMPGHDRRVWRRATIGLGAGFVTAALGYGVAMADAKSSADLGIEHLRAGLDAERKGDSEIAAHEFAVAAAELDATRKALRMPWAWPAHALPVLGPNARAVDEIVDSGATLASVAVAAVETADIDELVVERGVLDLGAIHRVEIALNDLDTSLRGVNRALRSRESPWLVGPVGDRLNEALRIVDDALPDVANALEAVRVAPYLLGEDAPRHYLVNFATPVEARGRTGFAGNFAELEANAGEIRMTRFGRIADLQRDGTPLVERKISGPPEYLMRYGRFEPAMTWQNVTMSPDFPSVAAVMAELYPQSGGRQIDGVLSVDPTALAALLELTGDVAVGGLAEPITAANALDYLQERQYVDLPNAERIDLLEAVARVTFERLTNIDLPNPRRMSEILSGSIDGGHLRFVVFDARVRGLLHRVGLDGAMPAVEGDSIAVVTNNAGGNKIDLFMRRTTTYSVHWQPETGAVSAELTMEFMNTAPTTGLPAVIIGNAIRPTADQPLPPPAGTNRLWLSVYSAWNPTSVLIDGRPTKLEAGRELGRFVVSGFVDIPAGATRIVTMSVAGSVPPGGPYVLDIAGQPQPTAEELHVTVEALGARPVITNGTNSDGTTARWDGPLRGDERIVVDAAR